MSLKPLLALIIMFMPFGYASAATIEIEDGADLAEKYALFGAAYRCSKSTNLSTIQRLEMNQIRDHYLKELQKDGVEVDFNIATGAADEKFGITRSNADYQKCEKAFKK